MKFKKKWLWGAGIAALVLSLFLILYFAVHPPFLSRGGWHETDTGAIQYRNYFGKPLSGWQY